MNDKHVHVFFVTVFFCLSCLACGGGNSDSKVRSQICGLDKALASGLETITFSFAGEERNYDLYIPPSYNGLAAPLVIELHGVGSTTALQAEMSRMREKADEEGFLILAPYGPPNADGTPVWNAGNCCAYDMTRDDVGLIEAAIDDALNRVCVDTSRVYIAGLSNGGHMAHRLACERSERFAAIASVAGGVRIDNCLPTHSVAVLSFHGTDDRIVPYQGGPSTIGTFGISAAETVAIWRSGTANSCSDIRETSFENGDVLCESAPECRDGVRVTLCTISGGGHTWPGIPETSAFYDAISNALGPITADIDATDTIWEFFSQYQRVGNDS